MLSRLDQYIFETSLKPLVLMTSCVTAVIWLSQVLQRIDFLAEDGGSLVNFLRMTVLILPNLLVIIIPFALFATSLYVLNRLQSDSEVTVMFSGGVSRVRLSRPLIALALSATFITGYIGMELSPHSYRTLKDIVRQARNDIAKSLIRSGEFTTSLPNMMVYVEEVLPGAQYKGLLIYDFRDPTNPATYMAESGLYRANEYGPRLHLVRGTLHRSPVGSTELDIVRFNETTVDMAPYQNLKTEFFREEKERTTQELLNPDKSDPYANDHYTRFIAEGHSRLATPLYALVYTLIATVALLHGETNRRGNGRKITAAIGVAIGVRVLGFVIQSAAEGTAFFNILQYALPIGVIVGCLYLLMDFQKLPDRAKRWRKPKASRGAVTS